MIETLIHIDQEIFLAINRGLQNPVFDLIMPIARNKWTWVPVYLFLAVFFYVKYKKGGLIMILAAVILAVACDQISSSLIKPLFERLRPCNDPGFADQVRTLITCGSGYSFTSSHATNHFGLSVLLSLMFYKKAAWILPLMLFWAILVSFAQIYVGVHYPFDTIGGAILGSIIALLVWLGYKKIIDNFALK